jgi:hypothetical protein
MASTAIVMTGVEESEPARERRNVGPHPFASALIRLLVSLCVVTDGRREARQPFAARPGFSLEDFVIGRSLAQRHLTLESFREHRV